MSRRATAIIGIDGTGKTSVGEWLANRVGGARRFEFYVGKQLYRGTLPFRALYRLNWGTVNWLQERIDEMLAPLTFGIAWLSLHALLLKRRWRRDERILVVDRFLPDFLYVRRKTDSPRFFRFTRPLSRATGAQIPGPPGQPPAGPGPAPGATPRRPRTGTRSRGYLYPGSAVRESCESRYRRRAHPQRYHDRR